MSVLHLSPEEIAEHMIADAAGHEPAVGFVLGSGVGVQPLEAGGEPEALREQDVPQLAHRPERLNWRELVRLLGGVLAGIGAVHQEFTEKVEASVVEQGIAAGAEDVARTSVPKEEA